MKRWLIASLSAMSAAIMAFSLMFAQSGSPVNDTFDTDVSGWAPTLHLYSDGNYYAYADITWQASKDFTIWWPPSTTHADGVVHITWRDAQYAPDIQKSAYLQPGAYRVTLRAGSDNDDRLLLDVTGGGVDQPGSYLKNDNGQLGTQWYTYVSDVFSVLSPGMVTFKLSSAEGFWLDSFQVDSYGGVSPTPYATQPFTPVPTENQATPIAVPTQFCQTATPTPSAPTFGVTPTVTPDTSSDMSYVDTFNYGSLASFWETTGSGYIHVNQTNTGPDNAAGILEMGYGTETDTALVLVHPVTPTVYVDGWAMADVLPAGTSAAVHVYLYNGSTWTESGSSSFSAGQWYPFHIAVTDPGGGPFAALAISVSGPGGYAYLDNLNIYNSLRLAPSCGFAVSSPETNTNSYINYPAGKPCPPDNSGIQDVPNNFWGPLFYWMSIQFLTATSQFQEHIYQGYALAIRAFGDAPFWRYVSVVTMMFDLRPVIALAFILVALEIIRLAYSVWRLFLKIIPMMG